MQSEKWEPFTIAHFRDWASHLVLDSDEPWELEPFQASFVEDVFAGPKVAWLIVPEGNGKTTLVAGLALYVIEFKTDAYVPVAASTRDQAEWIYRQAAGFVNRSKRKDFKCLEGYRRIRFDDKNSRIQVFAADDRGGDGIIPGGYAFLDELHRHKDLSLYRTWQGKLWKRKAQLIVISTAGEVGSEFEEERERFRQTADEIDHSGAFVRAVNTKSGAVLHEWALAEDAELDDFQAIKAANPFSGVTVDYLEEKRELPGMTLQHWARFTCNRASRAENAAIQEKEWHEAAVCPDDWPEGGSNWLGLDVAWKWDTTSMVPLYVGDFHYRLLGPATVLTPPRDGNSLDPNLVERSLIEIAENFGPFHTVVMDTSKAEQLAEWISSELGATVIDRQQTNPLAVQDYERFMEALREGWLRHTGDPMLTRHVLNAIARVLPRGDARFDRPHQSRKGLEQDMRVIDALTAASMVHSVAAAEMTMAGGLVY